MIYLTLLFLSLGEITITPHLGHIQNSMAILPALVLLAACLHKWRWLFLGFVAIVLTHLFVPFSFAQVTLLIMVCTVGGIIFWRWLDQTNRSIHAAVAALLLTTANSVLLPLEFLTWRSVVIGFVGSLLTIVILYWIMDRGVHHEFK